MCIKKPSRSGRLFSRIRKLRNVEVPWYKQETALGNICTKKDYSHLFGATKPWLPLT